MFSNPSRMSSPSSYTHTHTTIIIRTHGQRGNPAGRPPQRLNIRCTCRSRRSQRSRGEPSHLGETSSGLTRPFIYTVQGWSHVWGGRELTASGHVHNAAGRSFDFIKPKLYWKKMVTQLYVFWIQEKQIVSLCLRLVRKRNWIVKLQQPIRFLLCIYYNWTV